MKIILILFIFFKTSISIECNEYSDLYIMNIETNQSSKKPSIIFDGIKSSIAKSSDIQVCENFPPFFVEKMSHMDDSIDDSACNALVLCEKAVSEENIQKLHIKTYSPYIIPCKTWNNKLCASAYTFMDAHNCSNFEKCSSCCINPSKKAIFELHIFLIGTMLPIIIGTFAFVLLFFLIHSGNIIWSKSKKHSTSHISDTFLSISSFINTSTANTTNIITKTPKKTQSEKYKLPRSRSALRTQ